MENKKKKNWFKITLIGLFIVYIALYVLNVAGYYDANMRRKVEFTESQIEEFERGIANGEKVDIKDYLQNQDKDYTNNISRFGYNLGTHVDNFFNKTIEEILKILSKLLS